VTQDHRLTITAGSAEELTTGEQLGPGAGDRIVYFRNARLAWMTVNGQVSLCLLGADGLAKDSVAYLRRALSEQVPEEERSRLPPAPVIEELLGLDPFVSGGLGAVNDTRRFGHVQTYEGSGLGDTPDTVQYEHRVETADAEARASFSVRVEDYRTGLLSFLEIGVQRDETLRAESESVRISETTNTVGAAYRISFHAPAGQRYAYSVYYDRVFGSYVAVPAPVMTGAAWLSGVVARAGAGALQGELVELERDGRRYLTRSDAQGRYEFRSSDLSPGAYKLRAGGAEQTLNLTGVSAVANVTASSVFRPGPIGRGPGTPFVR
jgi:hypothetical protein